MLPTQRTVPNGPSAPQVPSLRQLQIDAVIRMLNYNETATSNNLTPSKKLEKPLWKVLVFDEYCQQLISLILRVNDLREQGVTLHLPIKTSRMPIADVPAIYLVQPTKENVSNLMEDLKRSLYDSSYINFASMLPRPLLEEFANGAVRENCADRISQVYDQYLSFMCPEANLFSLSMGQAYSELNGSNTSEADIESIIDKITTGLLSVLATMGSIPTIKASRGLAAEMIAKRLEMRLKDFSRSPTASLASSDSLFSGSANPRDRPVLLILDRNMDLIPMVSHSWNYQPLIHDLLDLKHNRVTVMEDVNGVETPKKYDLDSKDFFWAKNASLPFPQIAEAIDEELSKYKKEAEELTRSTGDMNESSSNTQHLKNAVTALPELTARKTVIDMHMAIATSLLQCIQKRHVDRFFELEESILREGKQAIIDVIKDQDSQPSDKLRLFLVYYLSHPNLPPADLTMFEDTLKEAGCDLSPLEALKKVYAVTRLSTLSAGNATRPTASNDLLDRFSSLGSQLRDNAYGRILSKVQNFLPTAKDLAVTRIVQSIIEPSSASVADLVTIDPKSRVPQSRSAKATLAPTSVIVFVVGGGSYLEYSNLQEFLQRHPSLKSIIYGSTEIMSPDQFVTQLSAL